MYSKYVGLLKCMFSLSTFKFILPLCTFTLHLRLTVPLRNVGGPKNLSTFTDMCKGNISCSACVYSQERMCPVH